MMLHPRTFLPRHPDQGALRHELAALRDTLAYTRHAQHLDVKHRADHGRALLRLAQALLQMEAEEDELEAYNEALEHMEEAKEIWQELGRARALHLAMIRIVELRSILATLPSQREAVMHRLTRLEEAQRKEPDTLQKPYRATLLATRARAFARAGQIEAAIEAAMAAIEMLEAMLKKDRQTPELTSLYALQETLEKTPRICTNVQALNT